MCVLEAGWRCGCRNRLVSSDIHVVLLSDVLLMLQDKDQKLTFATLVSHAHSAGLLPRIGKSSIVCDHVVGELC